MRKCGVLLASIPVAFVLSVTACSSKKAEPLERTPYDRDLERICMMEDMSGALHLEPGARALHTATWLATNMESREGRELSEKLTRLGPQERIDAVTRELKEAKFDKASIKACEILYAWGKKD